MILLFSTAVAFILVTYAGYPLAIYWLSRFRAALGPVESLDVWPSVSVICAAYNEQARVAAKIENLKSQDYPGPLQLVFVSDGSSDQTAGVLRADEQITPVCYAQRQGKAFALKQGVAAATGDVLVFTDARQFIAEGAIRALVCRLATAGVGVASGMLVHRDPETRQAQHIGLYWRYERAIRESESRWHSTVGATGALYAIRRADFVPPPDDTILDDFEIPMNVVKLGKRCVIERAAPIYDELQRDVSGESKRKARTLAGNYQSLLRTSWLWSPRKNPVFWQLLFHKVFRLIVPWALLLAWLSSGLAHSLYFRAFFWLQSAAYAIAVAGLLWAPIRRLPLLSFLVVFVELNVAAVRGLIHYIKGLSSARWEKTA